MVLSVNGRFKVVVRYQEIEKPKQHTAEIVFCRPQNMDGKAHNNLC